MTSTPSLTATATSTGQPTNTPTYTFSPTATGIFTFTPTNTASYTTTVTPLSTLTATLVNTETFTSTVSATPVNTNASPPVTRTPALTGNKTPILYPNPSDGTKPVNVLPPAYNGVSDVKVQFFTTTFRKVREIIYAQVTAGKSLSLDMKDEWGVPLASGIYYVVVSTGSERSVGKLLIIR
jgi:hypothetical protein